jgi:hypothetical protein
MRTLMKFSVPVEPGNVSIREGRLSTVLEQTIGRLKPEAAYFFADRGERGGFVVFDLADPSEIPVIAEPLFMGLDAAVEFLPVMNLDDLRKALASLGASASAGTSGTARTSAVSG